MQEATYRLAEKQIAGIITSKLINGKGHGTKGKDAKGILISIYDVYDAIIQNSIVDVSHFNTSNATSLEKSVYQTFSRTKKSAINRVKKNFVSIIKRMENSCRKQRMAIWITFSVC